jgi:hypothetical protein
MSLITYEIKNDYNDKLKATAKIACNFWNYFLSPKLPIILFLDTFDSNKNIIAKATRPDTINNLITGKVSYNIQFLNKQDEKAIAGTLIHEIGHILGFGSGNNWTKLFYGRNHDKAGQFFKSYIEKLPELKEMRVEMDQGDLGTLFKHWDEELFKEELMTGFKDHAEYVLPITIKIMSLFDHILKTENQLTTETSLNELIDKVKVIEFSEHDKLISNQFKEDIITGKHFEDIISN